MRELDATLSRLARELDGTVLDFGCGDMPYAVADRFEPRRMKEMNSMIFAVIAEKPGRKS